MSAPLDIRAAAGRLIADLMPIALTVSGPGEADFAAALEAVGGAPEIFAAGAQGPFDLAILLTPPDAARDPAEIARIQALAAATDRLLLVPIPLGEAGKLDLDTWFELFAEHGFQPVVEYDAAFLGQGAFLVDRNATAAESELSAFAERLALGGALATTSQRVAVLEAELAEGGDRDQLRKSLDAAQAEIAALAAREAAWRARAEQAEAEAADLNGQISAWQPLGAWITAVSQNPARDTLAALHAARGTTPKRPRIFARLFGQPPLPSQEEAALLQDAAAIRACALFDAAWYLAQRPEAAESGADPVWDYLFFGAAAGADPGPWFDSKAYLETFPEARANPLLHAINTGEAAKILAEISKG